MRSVQEPGQLADAPACHVAAEVILTHCAEVKVTHLGEDDVRSPQRSAALQKFTVTTNSQSSTTALGNWYATTLFWQPQVALLVNERTLLPVLMQLAPAATLAARFPDELATILAGHGVSQEFIATELAAMSKVSVAKTANRSVLGTMNEFAFLAEGYREHMETQRTVRPGPSENLSTAGVDKSVDNFDLSRCR
jgi:hypothetical protein